MESRWWTGGVRRWQGAWFDPSGPHVGQELVWNFGEHFLSQPSHAEDVVSPSVNVVSEGHELEERSGGEEWRRGGGTKGYGYIKGKVREKHRMKRTQKKRWI